MNDSRSSRLKRYYEELYRQKNMRMPESAGHVIDSLSDDDQRTLEKTISDKDPLYRRLSAYSERLSQVLKNESVVREAPCYYGSSGNEGDEFFNTMQEIASPKEKYDYSSEKKVMLNGNIFTYRDDFPIDKYREQLSHLGDDGKGGNQWDVSIDDDGELVVY